MKEKKVKLRTKVFRFTVIILFIMFLTLFVSNKNGYYEYQKKTNNFNSRSNRTI